MIDNLRCANLSSLFPALRFVAFTITLLFCCLNTVFCLLSNCKLSADPKHLLSQGHYIVRPSIAQFLKNQKHKKNTWHFPLHAFRKILPSIPPPSNVSRHFFPFLKKKGTKIFEMHFCCILQDTYLLFVCKRNAKSLERPAFLPGTFSIAWFALLLTLPST